MEFLQKIKKPWKILAPMVGNSGLSWRTLARIYNADVCYTEMINCKSFLRTKINPKSNQWYTTNKLDRPLIIQICGNNSLQMLEVAKHLEDYCDAIDVNFGCPQEIARKGNYGSFLQDDWETTKEIVKTLSDNLKVPVTCKIRIFESVEKTVEYSKIIRNAGCKMLVVHGRTKEQRGVNTGLASWDHIRAVKAALDIPVVSNGNILYNSDIDKCIAYTKCDGVMVGETHLYNPLIFVPVHAKTSIMILRQYLTIVLSCVNKHDLKSIKSHSNKLLHTFLKFHPDFRTSLNDRKSFSDYLEVCNQIEQYVSDNDVSPNCLSMLPYIR